MLKFILTLSCLIFSNGLKAAPLKVQCIGTSESEAKGYLVYLHGFEKLDSKSQEEEMNQEALNRLAKDLKLRIAIPEGPICPKNRRCWPAKTKIETEQSFFAIQKAKDQCFRQKPYTLLGFSNGGYFAFKLYKINQDRELKSIIASSSSGLWDSKEDRANTLSRFSLMIGDRDITRGDAEAFIKKLKSDLSNLRFQVFAGGHKVDFETLRTWLIEDMQKNQGLR